jgi:hypothetical protein
MWHVFIVLFLHFGIILPSTHKCNIHPKPLYVSDELWMKKPQLCTKANFTLVTYWPETLTLLT